MTRMSLVNSVQEKKDKADQVRRFKDRLAQRRQQLLAKRASEELEQAEPATRYVN